MRTIHLETNSVHLHRALFSDWEYSDPPPFMRWDPNEFRPHALRGSDPAKDRKQNNVRGANRLAIEALPIFPTVPKAHRIHTVAFENRDSDEEVTWPVWGCQLDLPTVRSLVVSSEIQCPDRLTMMRRGIAQVFCSTRFTEGKYRNFSPAKALI